MNFINGMPIKYKYKLIKEIEKRQIYLFGQQNAEDAERMSKFVEAWKRSGFSGQYVDSCVYPEAFISDEEKQL